MLERLHDHIVSELAQGSRTDMVFVVVAVLFNLISLGINSASAGSAASASRNNGAYSLAADLVLAVFIVMSLLVNAIALGALNVGRQTRGKLLAGLIGMYTDNHVAKYYDSSLISNYGTRYLLFAAVILILAVTSILVPLIIRML